MVNDAKTEPFLKNGWEIVKYLIILGLGVLGAKLIPLH